MGIIKNTLAIFGGYFFLLAGLDVAGKLASEKIKGKENIERVVIEESEKLGINPKTIRIVNYNEAFVAAYTKKVGDNLYEMGLGKEIRRATVKHECYHIANGHCEKPSDIIDKLFILEPQAIIYATTGLKL